MTPSDPPVPSATWTNSAGWELPVPATEQDHRLRYPADWIRYDFAALRARGKRVVDCACGAGYGSWLLAKSGATQVIGVDTSEEAISWATQHFRLPTTDFRLGDGRSLPVEDNSVDLVVSFETIEHIPVVDVPGFITSLARSLVGGGTLIISTPLTLGPERLKPRNSFHVREYSDVELAELLAPHFDVTEFLGQHSAGSRQFSDFKRLPGLGAIVRSGAHRLLPEPARAVVRRALGGASRESRPAWISADRWREAPVQVLVGRRK